MDNDFYPTIGEFSTLFQNSDHATRWTMLPQHCETPAHFMRNTKLVYQVKPCWCLPGISNGTNSPRLALLYRRNFGRGHVQADVPLSLAEGVLQIRLEVGDRMSHGLYQMVIFTHWFRHPKYTLVVWLIGLIYDLFATPCKHPNILVLGWEWCILKNKIGLRERGEWGESGEWGENDERGERVNGMKGVNRAVCWI